jgi:hypothetical protein
MTMMNHKVNTTYTPGLVGIISEESEQDGVLGVLS